MKVMLPGLISSMAILQTNPATTASSYSAQMRLELWIGEKCIPLSQTSHDRVICRDSTLKLSSGPAELRVQIDQAVHRWQINIQANDAVAGYTPIEIVRYEGKTPLAA
jgi:hypothetical protein